ncbi:MAG: GAF domain-containing protein [Cyanobacteria bacterium RM1_2_2]|nr:GAF domain-containing protein [Cyanobacteria bacterium RM1_2_2]
MSLSESPLEQLLSSSQLDQLQAILEQMAQVVDAQVLTETTAASELSTNLEHHLERFVVVISQPFSALMWGQALQAGDVYQTALIFDPEAIRLFVSQLGDRLPNSAALQAFRQSLGQGQISPDQILLPQANDPALQSQFTLKLVSLLGPTHCESTEMALRQQIEQERLLNQVATQIRQSLELPVILKTAVEQVRQFLQVDRLVIYQLDVPASGLTAVDLAKPNPANHNSANQNAGKADPLTTNDGAVIYEARAAETIPTVMNLSDAHCFMQELRFKDWQSLQIAAAIDDVEVQYQHGPCLLEFLRRAQVRAKLIAPIRLQERLWGLLIAHQCWQPRQWQESEQRFLQQIAENLAIAISQAQLYAELQQQKQTLEQRVVERTQALREAMLAAQSANRAKSEFLAAVSHELRTPLACIIGMSATLQRWSKDVLTERQQHFLQTIHDSGEHLSAMINDILDLSQAEAGRMVLNLREFSMSRLAQQTLKTFEGQAALQEIDLDLDLHLDPTRDRFTADPRRVRQILFNLIGNAIKFTSARGKVTLRVFTQPNVMVLQVKDTGIGIPEPQLPLLFQKFQQLDTSYHREYSGTGLGLALTKQLVELHNGWIEVESTVGVGSIFTVKLPILSPSPNKPLLPSTSNPDQNQKRVVLVEPNEETASLICDLLLAAGYQVVWILEGASAISQIEVLLPAAVIMSLRLPDINGHHIIRSLRQNPGTKSLKILALTGQLKQSEQANSSETDFWKTVGADDTLPHPIRPEALLRSIRELTAQNQMA